MIRYYILFFLLFALAMPQRLSAQKKKAVEPTSSLRLKLNATREVRRLYGFEQIYQSLRPKLTVFYMDKKGEYRTSYSYFPRLDTVTRDFVWDTLPYGTLILSIASPAFQPISDTLYFGTPERGWERNLLIDSTLYTYNKDGEKYEYLRGSLNFSNTFIVGFKSGEPIANYDLLVALLPNALRIQKTIVGNSFYITIPTEETRTLQELLDEKNNPKQAPVPRGYFIGPQITQAIETILYETDPKTQVRSLRAGIRYIYPTFIDDKPEEARMLDPKTVQKSERLQQKQMLQLQNGSR